MDDLPKRRSILDWDENDVQDWFSALGYPQYESQIKEHNISGDVLCMLDPEGLKAVGVSTVGQRLSILKAIYQVKVGQNVPIAHDSYVPPSEASDLMAPMTVDKLQTIVMSQAEKIHNLQEENRFLQQCLQAVSDEVNNIRQFIGRGEESSPLRRQSSFKWAQYDSNRSPTKADMLKHDQSDSPHPSPQHQQFPQSHDKSRAQQQARADSPSRTGAIDGQPKPVRQDSADNLKSFKVSLDDPTWKVLPAALKKYRINNDNWQNYAMFICYGAPGNRTERCLSLDEKPLLLFQRLKDAKKNPVFMLKHIKDIRSPIAVAQQKHAARKATSLINVGNEPPSENGKSSTLRPPRLEISDLSDPASNADASGGVSGGLAVQPAWPDGTALSPMTESSQDMALSPSTAKSPDSKLRGGASPIDNSYDSGNIHPVREIPVPSVGLSYAVAIYPYMAEQDDEFDVIVGDTFVIISRARGWWVVQRDRTGFGNVEQDPSKQGWVPAGCLLETNVPVASAIAEAKGITNDSGSPSSPDTPTNKTPILPLSIISTSFPGIALMDYKKKGDEELDLAKDDLLRVFKRYNHWSYAVKEEGGDRGWVPSWYIGKVATNSGPPPQTPSTSTHPTTALNAPDDLLNGQPSPMSSAFPVVSTRMAAAA